MQNLARQIEYGSQMANTAEQITWVSGTKAAVGDTQVIATPGLGRQIVLVSILLQNETSTAQTMLLKAAGSTFLRVRAANDGDGLARSSIRIPCGVNNAIQLNASGASQIGYTLGYIVEDAQ